MSNRILDYPEATEITSNDYILLDNEGTGAKCIKASALNINMDNYTIKEARGAIASFDDGEDLPLAFMGAYIEPVQDLHGYDYPWVGGAGKNKFDIGDVSSSYWNVSGEQITNAITDTRQNFQLVIQGYYNGQYTGISYLQENITSTGRVSFTFTIGNNDNVDQLLVKHNGAQQDIIISFVNWTQKGDVTISFDVSGYNPTVAGGVVFSNMQIESSSTATSYAPYSNICPISGWTACNVTRSGANLFDKTTITENKIINNNTGEETTSYGRFSSDYIKVNSSTDYYASNVIKSAQWYCAFYYDKNKNYLSCGELSSTGDTASGVITTPSNCNYVRLVGVSTYKDDVSFVVGNQAPSSYSAYNGNTYTIQLGDTYYGGTLDVVSGVLTVTHQIVDLGDATWSYNDLTNVFDSSKIASSVVKPTSSTEVIDLQCSILAKNSSSGITDNPSVDGIAINTLGYIIARYSGMPTSSQDFKTAVTGQKLKFPLATPLTYQLTPQMIYSLIGENNIFADTGDSIVDYRKLWVKPEM